MRAGGTVFTRTVCVRGRAWGSRAQQPRGAQCAPFGYCPQNQRRLPFSLWVSNSDGLSQPLWHLDGSRTQSFLPVPCSPHPTKPIRGTLNSYIVLGLLLIVFALGFLQWRSAVITAGWRRAITALLVLSGLGFVMAALFLPDPVGDLQLSVHAMLHEIAFTLVFLPLGISCLLIGNQFRKIAGWRIHGWYSMITGLPTSLAALGSLSGLFSPTLPPSLGGLFERILIVIDFAWLVILASRMLMQEREG